MKRWYTAVELSIGECWDGLDLAEIQVGCESVAVGLMKTAKLKLHHISQVSSRDDRLLV